MQETDNLVTSWKKSDFEKFLPSEDLFYFIAKHRNCTDDILSLKFGTIK